jgi:AraC-like DNA-binding protein
MSYRPLRSNVRLANSIVRTHTAAPAPDLARHLLEFFQYEVPDDVPFAPVQIYPSGVAVLRFDIREHDVEATVFGPSLSPHVRGLFFRGIPIFGVAIRATHAHALLGLELSELRNLRVQLDVLWPRRARNLNEQLWEARGFEQRVAVLSQFIRGVLRPHEPEADFLCTFQALVRTGGALSLKQGRGSGASERTLRRQFARFVGISPKQMARVIRFQQLLAGVAYGSPCQFAELAQRSGYSDQAHMTRDFADLVGIPPGKFVAYLPKLHDPRLDFWSRLRTDPHEPTPAILRLGE